LPRFFLDGAVVKHNARFLPDYITGNKNHFIEENINYLISLNNSGLKRYDFEGVDIPVLSNRYNEYKRDTTRFIAHAGGRVDGYKYTNSLEALNASYAKGFRLFELDVIETSDGQFFAAHDWEHWSEIAGYQGDLPVDRQEFLKHQIHGKYTPVDMELLNEWFSNHEDAILVTDKINKPKEFANAFVDNDRLVMELFDEEAVKGAIDLGLMGVMPSQVVVDNLRGDKVEKLNQLGVSYIAVSRNYIHPNLDFFRELKKSGIKVFVYHVNFDPLIDENYVVRYEMDDFYGIYADDWDFGRN
jgi:lipoteichoic acid synthase